MKPTIAQILARWAAMGYTHMILQNPATLEQQVTNLDPETLQKEADEWVANLAQSVAFLGREADVDRYARTLAR